MTAESLTEKTFPDLKITAITPIFQGGSMRSFHRVHFENHPPLICVIYNPEKEENKHYGRLARWLDQQKVPVPKVFAESTQDNALWIEDLGENELGKFSLEKRFSVYEKVIDAIAILHSTATAAWKNNPIPLMPPFDETLYNWEHNYFFEKGLKLGLKKQFTPEQEEKLRTIFGQQKHILLSEPTVLLHRDFQSQNILIRADGSIGFIDFQGMRLGVAEYDLASLLFDPYVPEFSEDEIEKFLRQYAHATGKTYDHVKQIFRVAGTQRLMQAIGAYGYLGIECKKSNYLPYLDVALSRLQKLVVLPFD